MDYRLLLTVPISSKPSVPPGRIPMTMSNSVSAFHPLPTLGSSFIRWVAMKLVVLHRPFLLNRSKHLERARTGPAIWFVGQ